MVARKEGWKWMPRLRRMPVPEGPETPGPKGRRQHKKWLSPLFKGEIWVMKTKSVWVKGGRNTQRKSVDV